MDVNWYFRILGIWRVHFNSHYNIVCDCVTATTLLHFLHSFFFLVVLLLDYYYYFKAIGS